MRSLDGLGGLRLCAKVKATYPCRSCRWTHAHAQARTVEAWGGVQQQCVWVVVAVVGERKASLNKEEMVVGVQSASMLVIIAPAFQLLTCDRPVLTLNCPLALTPESRVQSAAHIL